MTRSPPPRLPPKPAMKRNSPQSLRRDAVLLRRDTTGERRAVFRLVTQSVDRHGTVIEPAGVDFSHHQAAGSPFLWMHEAGGDIGRAPPPDVVIGRVAEYLQTPQALDIVVIFHDDGPGGLATKCWEKVQAGLIRMVSIGAFAHETETRTVNGAQVLVYTKTELVEASLVIVGSNRDALRLDRAAVLRVLDNMTKEIPMDKAALCKLLNLDEAADRETAEAALIKYLTETSDAPEARKAAAEALDQNFPESPEGEDMTRAQAEDDETKTEVEALRTANAELTRALQAAKAEQAAAPKPEQVAAETVKREAQIAADVDRWIGEGRVQRSERSKWINDHRAGKAAKVVRHIPVGTWTSNQRLSGGTVGTPVDDLPARPETETRGIARSLVAAARSMNRDSKAGAAAQQAAAQTETQTEAKSLVAQARALRG